MTFTILIHLSFSLACYSDREVGGNEAGISTSYIIPALFYSLYFILIQILFKKLHIWCFAMMGSN